MKEPFDHLRSMVSAEVTGDLAIMAEGEESVLGGETVL